MSGLERTSVCAGLPAVDLLQRLVGTYDAGAGNMGNTCFLSSILQVIHPRYRFAVFVRNSERVQPDSDDRSCSEELYVDRFCFND